MSPTLSAEQAPSISLSPTQGVLCVMNQEGDTKTIWDRANPAEVENARKSFDHFKAKGYAAYSVKGTAADKGEVVHKFDPDAERIIFAPPMQGG